MNAQDRAYLRGWTEATGTIRVLCLKPTLDGVPCHEVARHILREETGRMPWPDAAYVTGWLAAIKESGV